MASLVSHLSRRPEGGLVLLGMNAAELAANPVAEEHVLRDLNRDPELPFADAAFDAVTCCVSIDYLARPVEVLREVARVLRSAGRVSPSASARSSSFAETPGPATKEKRRRRLHFPR